VLGYQNDPDKSVGPELFYWSRLSSLPSFPLLTPPPTTPLPHLPPHTGPSMPGSHSGVPLSHSFISHAVVSPQQSVLALALVVAPFLLNTLMSTLSCHLLPQLPLLLTLNVTQQRIHYGSANLASIMGAVAEEEGHSTSPNRLSPQPTRTWIPISMPLSSLQKASRVVPLPLNFSSPLIPRRDSTTPLHLLFLHMPLTRTMTHLPIPLAPLPHTHLQYTHSPHS
jgi:hypothetical protein